MAVMKKMESEVPRRSGCNNNEEDAEELQLLLEELLELTSASASNATASKSNAFSAASTLAEDKRNADVLRRAAVDMVSADEIRELRNGKKKRKTATPNCVSPPATTNMSLL